MTDTQFDDANDDEVAIASVPQPTAMEVLSDEALDRALTRKVRTLLTRGPCVLIVQVPEADWVEPIDEALGRFAKNAVTKKATELTRSSGVDHRVGGESLRFLQRGRSVIYISQDPDEILDEAVIAAADALIKISPPTPALLRKIIRRVGRGTARGVTAEMAGLPLTVILSAIRPGLAARQCVANLGRAALKGLKAPASRVPLLTALPLSADLRGWTNRTVADLAAVTSGSLSADQLVFGVLEGAPGTGKTLIAESLARTAGWSFVPSSVGDWFTSGDGALGGVARNLRGFVDAVLAAENTIGFMDELDSLPDRATMEDRSRTWWTPIINLFLIEIDRLRKSNRKILLLGGTNFYGRLDKALVRPGRLQQRITVMPPQTIDEVVAVLRFYLGDQLRQVDLGSLARIGLGATPAMIEGWVKQARGAARADNRQLQPADILAQMVPEDLRAPTDVRAIALHEAGHALVAHRLGHAVETVSIIPEGDSGGHTRSALPTLVPTLDHVRCGDGHARRSGR